LRVYGIDVNAFKEMLGKPSATGTWVIPKSPALENILDADCPPDYLPDEPNTVRHTVHFSAPKNPRCKKLPDIVLYHLKASRNPELTYDPWGLWVNPDLYAWRFDDIDL
jgi:hypothetical protein